MALLLSFAPRVVPGQAAWQIGTSAGIALPSIGLRGQLGWFVAFTFSRPIRVVHLSCSREQTRQHWWRTDVVRFRRRDGGVHRIDGRRGSPDEGKCPADVGISIKRGAVALAVRVVSDRGFAANCSDRARTVGFCVYRPGTRTAVVPVDCVPDGRLAGHRTGEPVALMTSRRLAFEESIAARARQSGESGEAAEGAVGEDDIGAPEVDLVCAGHRQPQTDERHGPVAGRVGPCWNLG